MGEGRVCAPHPVAAGHPVTGGVKTPITPTRGFLQLLLATGWKTTMPAFIGLTVCLTMPLLLERLVVSWIVEPLTRILMPALALPCWVTFIVSVFLWPTRSCLGETLTAVQ